MSETKYVELTNGQIALIPNSRNRLIIALTIYAAHNLNLQFSIDEQEVADLYRALSHFTPNGGGLTTDLTEGVAHV